MIENSKTGILVDPDNSQQLAENIIYLFQNPGVRKKLGMNAKKLARIRHYPNKIAEETIKAYEEILMIERKND